jgi:hypothetical protein
MHAPLYLAIAGRDEAGEAIGGRELAFLYQDKTADGQTSRFFKFIHRSEGR